MLRAHLCAIEVLRLQHREGPHLGHILPAASTEHSRDRGESGRCNAASVRKVRGRAGSLLARASRLSAESPAGILSSPTSQYRARPARLQPWHLSHGVSLWPAQPNRCPGRGTVLRGSRDQLCPGRVPAPAFRLALTTTERHPLSPMDCQSRNHRRNSSKGLIRLVSVGTYVF